MEVNYWCSPHVLHACCMEVIDMVIHGGDNGGNDWWNVVE
jgi:hypothetical protein